jgi:lipopolysaccharide transport system permease protein
MGRRMASKPAGGNLAAGRQRWDGNDAMIEGYSSLLTTNWLTEVWRYRELFYFFAWRDVKIRYKQTVLGGAWAILQPLFTMVVFTVLFGHLGNMPSDGIPHPIFYYSALVPWTYFSGALAFSANSLVGNASLLTKVYFPRVALPASSVLSGLVDFAVASIVLIAMMVYYGVPIGWRLLLWPVLVVPLVVLTLGTGMLLAALNVRFRDIKHAIPFATQLWLFVTPIIYPTSFVPERFRILLMLNPLAGLIDGFRASILPERQVDWQLLAISTILTLVIFAVANRYFRRTERDFADIV